MLESCGFYGWFWRDQMNTRTNLFSVNEIFFYENFAFFDKLICIYKKLSCISLLFKKNDNCLDNSFYCGYIEDYFLCSC